MKNAAYYNGKICAIEDMMVPMNDRACYYGDGVYDAAAVMNKVALGIDEHIDRFFRSAAFVRIEIPMDKQELKKMLQDLVGRVDARDQFLYWQVTRGVGMRGHAFRFAGDRASLWAFTRPCEFEDVYEEYACITVEDTRFFHCNIKTIDLLPNVLAAQKAEEAGCREAIFHRGERVTECAHSNVHILKNGVFITAPTDELILPGIARARLLRLCREELSIPVEERPFTLAEMMDADEIFTSSSSAAPLRVTVIDGKKAGGRDEKTFSRLREAYQTMNRRECGLEA